ncbi:MAG: DUF2341 domain-containing protein [Candidatus Thorarchaeota archaeon]
MIGGKSRISYGILFLFVFLCVLPFPDLIIKTRNLQVTQPLNETTFADTDWLEGWTYRKSHVINGQEGVGVNYQIRLVVNYGSGYDDGEEVFCYEHCKSDFRDLRFTSDDGISLYDYWIQNYTASLKSIFWIEVSDILNETLTMYIYYGNQNANSTSNGYDTFAVFDDFNRNDSEIVGNGWIEDESNSHANITDETLSISGTVDRYCHIEKNIPTSECLALEGRIWGAVRDREGWYTALSVYWDRFTWNKLGFRRPDKFVETTNEYGAISGSIHSTPSASTETWYDYRMELGTLIRSYFSMDGGYTWMSIPYPVVRPEELSGNITKIILGRGFSDRPDGYYKNSNLDNNYSVPGEYSTAYIDNVFLRKFAYANPTHGEFGREEATGIVDDIPPTISQPADLSFEEGMTNQYVTWVISDEHPWNYSVSVNSVTYTFGDWILPIMNVTVNLDSFETGIYNFTNLVNDINGNSATDSVLVEVTPSSSSTELVTTPTSSPNTTSSGGFETMILRGVLTTAIAVEFVVILVLIWRKYRNRD